MADTAVAPRRATVRLAARPPPRRADRLGRAGGARACSSASGTSGDRPFHHDESQDAYFSWLFRTSGDYEYDPLLHGPLRFYMTAAAYLLFGDSDFTARLAPGG